MTLVTRTIVGAALLSLVLPIGSAWATVQMLTDAKAAGMPAKSCQYCHREAMPKNAKALNDRGKFLQTDMQARGLTAPDMKKLGDFPGGKEQK